MCVCILAFVTQHADRVFPPPHHVVTCGLSGTTVKKKVKCTLVQALRLCTGRTAHRGSRGIALLFLDHGTRRGWRATSRPGQSLLPGKTRYPLYRRLGGPQGRSGRAENLAPTGIRSPDRPARSQSLYRLRYPAHGATVLFHKRHDLWGGGGGWI